MHFSFSSIGKLKHSKPSLKSTGQFFGLLFGNHLTPHSGEVVFEDPQDAPKPFKPHYDQHIRPHIQAFEAKRIECLKAFRFRSFLFIPGLVLVFAVGITTMLLAHLPKEGNDIIMFLMLLSVVGLVTWCAAPVIRYKSSVKGDIFPNIFSFFGSEFHYDKEGLSSVSLLENSDLLPNYNRSKTEDLVRGSYKDVSLELTEATLKKVTGSGKNRRTRIMFQGMFVTLGMNKNFSGKTIVKKDAGRLFNWISDKFNKLKNVTLEDPIFEKQFEVYSNDQVEARYLLTTSFMERLLELSKLVGRGDIQCSFYENKLLLMIPSKKNRFEVSSIFTPATFEDDINHILAEMNVIFKLIDVLKLNEKTGL